MAIFSGNNSSVNFFLSTNRSPNNEQFFQEGTEAVMIVCLYSMMSLIAIFGNLLVIAAVYCDYTLRSYTSNYFLANLAVADFFQGAISIPLRILEVMGVNYDPNVLCRVAIPTSILFGGGSNLGILIISIDRFLAIQYPYLYLRYATMKTIFGVLALKWTMSCALGITAATRLVWLTPEISTKICRFPVYLTSDYILAMYVIVHAIPIGTVVLLYGFILKATLRQARRIRAQEVAVATTSNVLNDDEKTPSNCNDMNSRTRRRQAAKQRKGAKTVSIIVGLFILLVLPIIAIDLAEMLGAPPAPSLLTKITVCMIYANNCVNVLVYAGFNQDYRRAFKRILQKCACRFKRIILCR